MHLVVHRVGRSSRYRKGLLGRIPMTPYFWMTDHDTTPSTAPGKWVLFVPAIHRDNHNCCGTLQKREVPFQFDADCTWLYVMVAGGVWAMAFNGGWWCVMVDCGDDDHDACGGGNYTDMHDQDHCHSPHMPVRRLETCKCHHSRISLIRPLSSESQCPFVSS